MAATLTPAQERCWEHALKLNREARANPDSPCAGKRLGLVDGELKVGADGVEQMLAKLSSIEPDQFGLAREGEGV